MGEKCLPYTYNVQNQTIQGNAWVIAHCCTLTILSCQVPLHISTQPQVESLPGKRCYGEGLAIHAPAHCLLKRPRRKSEGVAEASVWLILAVI